MPPARVARVDDDRRQAADRGIGPRSCTASRAWPADACRTRRSGPAGRWRRLDCRDGHGRQRLRRARPAAALRPSRSLPCATGSAASSRSAAAALGTVTLVRRCAGGCARRAAAARATRRLRQRLDLGNAIGLDLRLRDLRRGQGHGGRLRTRPVGCRRHASVALRVAEPIGRRRRPAARRRPPSRQGRAATAPRGAFRFVGRAMATGRSRPPLGCRSWSAHLLGRRDPHQIEATADDLPDAAREFQPRARKLWIVFNEEAPRRIVVAAVPQGMELGRQIVEVEGDAVRLMRHRRAFDHARILRGALDQRQFLVVEQAPGRPPHRGRRPPRPPCASAS